MPRDGLLFDVAKCTDCSACVLACRETNGQPPDTSIRRLSDTAYLALEKHGDKTVRKACMHCLTPACVSVCPVGALQSSDSGAVTYDKSRCMGCRYCMMSCPFSVPRYEWSSTLPYLKKCELCLGRRRADGATPCASVCATGALVFGEREPLLHEARRRIAGGGYVDRIYGETEAGGTTLLYVSDVPFEALGLPTGLPEHALPELTWAVLEHIPRVVTVAGIGMAGLGWIIARREKLREANHG